MNEGFAEAVKEEILAACELGLHDFSLRRIDDIRELISVDVEPQGFGQEPIRSSPGEPPRKEFGDLQRSVQTSYPQRESIGTAGSVSGQGFTMSAEGSSTIVSCDIFTDDPAAEWLDDGFTHAWGFEVAARPWWSVKGGNNTAEGIVLATADELVEDIARNL